MSADEGYISFTGGSAEEAEDFITAVTRRAYSKGKHKDDAWISDLASVCFEKKARRWYEGLDEETQNDWKLLKRAILEEYKEVPPPPSTVPTSASASKSPGQGSIPAAALPFRIGRIRVECDVNDLRGYISTSKSSNIYNHCIVSRNQSTAALFEFDGSTRTIKFQDTADDYLAARLRESEWDSGKTYDNYALLVKVSGQTVTEVAGWSAAFRVDVWSVVDENKLVGRWPLKAGGFWELEACGYTTSKDIYFAKNYQQFATCFGFQPYKPVTIFFEPLS